jgi:hypothetical protein
VKERGRFFEKNARAGLVGQRRLRKKLLLLAGFSTRPCPQGQKFFWFFFFKKRTAFLGYF